MPAAGLADQVLLQNGDCYYGQVLSLTTNALVFQSDVLGKVTLPRQRVTQVSFGAYAAAKPTQPQSAVSKPSSLAVTTLTNSNPDLAKMLRQLGSQTNLLQQVQTDYLDAAGPEADKEFQRLIGGLTTGRISAADIRTEAKSAADQLRSFKQDLGPEFSEALDGYLAILETFLEESTPTPAKTQKTPATGPHLKSSVVQKNQ